MSAASTRSRPRIAVAILAGGASRRMGCDKAALLLEGMTLLERAARVALAAGAAQALVIGRDRSVDWPLPEVTFAADPPERAGIGPLGGVATALEAAAEAGCEAALVTACDMPALNPDALRWLMRKFERRSSVPVQGIITRGADGQVEPLFSLYAVSCLPLLRERIAAGRLSLQGAVAAGEFAYADVPPEVAAALANVNTPEELAAFEEARRFSPRESS